MLTVNLNEIIKVKYTDYGRDIYYHRFDDLIARGALCLKPSYPKVDEDGYSEIQLWEFIQIFGPHIRMGMPEVITENNSIYLDECGNDFREAVEHKEEVVEEEKRVSECMIEYDTGFDGIIFIKISYNDSSTETHTVKRYAGGIRYVPEYFIGRTKKEALELIREMSVGM